MSALPNKPRVSIVVPSYNSGAYIEDTIRSILEQEYDPIELIIVDGASTDGTLDILHMYDTDTRVRWISEPDSGNVEAQNKGLKLATGEIVGFQNANDFYLPGAVPEMVQEFASGSQVALVGGWVQLVDVHGIPTGTIQKRRQEFGDYTLEDILTFKGFTKFQATFFRRDVLQSIGGFHTEVKVPGAFLWTHYMLEASRLGMRCMSVPEVWASFREHPNQQHNLPGFTELSAYHDRNWGCKYLAKLYRGSLSRKQIRTLRRSGYYFILKHRVRVLRQVMPAVPAALGYLWYGGGMHLLKKTLPSLARLALTRARAAVRKGQAGVS